MVFESIVVDVLNKFLGDYVENLNRSQLKLGIWGGDVVLENLVLKQNALEELNIPVQTVYGHLGKLTLKIPWKNLYGASVEAQIERLFLVVNPNAEVKYDQEKEDKMALATKQAELARVEEAKKKEAEEDKMDETFVEKLVTQIIKNVQLTIKDIHIRYEDSITNPKQPFSLGMTLHNLSVHTTDENWKQTVVTEAVTKIFKILSLEGLAIYWNPETELYAKTGAESIKNRLQQEIATKTSQPSFYSYALGPINATAKLKLNTKPESETPKFNTPKVTLSLHMEQLGISLSKGQYRDMMLMFDSMDRMSKGMPYRKYRPYLKTYRGHYKEWWKFAYTCILEEEVRRRRNNWDWAHMLQHRQLCKNYATAYQSKLTSKGKVSPDQQIVLDEAEKRLDLLNLVVIRQRIEMEVERLGKLEAEARKSRGWFSGWWTSANAKDDQLAENTDILKQFQNAMTPEEKEKLFRAIDYQENSAPLHLPVEYVAVCGEFRLDRLQLTVLDDTPVLAAAVDAVSIHFYQRPSANAISLRAAFVCLLADVMIMTEYQENSLPLHLPVEYVSVCGEFRLDRLQLTVLDDTPVLAAAVDAVSIHFYQRPSANAIRLDRLQLTVLDDTPVLAAAVDAVSIHFYQRPSANAYRLSSGYGYQENSLPLHLPVEYVSVCGEFRLDRLQLTVLDDTPVLAAAVDAVSIHFYQRPSANAYRYFENRLEEGWIFPMPILV
ncbi:vacuolar protein sorting-associated protein 13 [Phthorimaea operculella]|nr:vacuolar protein sorting-associated protein 13 [Phthorimaea operculella]